MKNTITTFAAVALISGCDSVRVTPSDADRIPAAVKELAVSVALLHQSLVSAEAGGLQGADQPLTLTLTHQELMKNGNCWFSFDRVIDGQVVLDSDLSVEIEPATMKVRVTHMAFPLHSKGAQFDPKAPDTFVSFKELEQIWRGETPGGNDHPSSPSDGGKPRD